MEHTPGPWRVERYEIASEFRPGEKIPLFNVLGVNLTPDAYYSGAHFTVCSELDSEADARLIAAAPSLLAALEELDDWYPLTSCPCDGTREHHSACPVRRARAAIALAKSERDA